MKDLTVRLENRPGALADMGEALGRAGVNLEGGGAFVVGNEGVAHFLVSDAAAARKALEAAGIDVVRDREVLVQRLDQGKPGQLGAIAREMARGGVNIEVVYSDHQNQLVLGVDNLEKGRSVSDRWMANSGMLRTVREHRYNTTVTWTGNTGTGTSAYRDYRRDHEISAKDKMTIPGSSDPHFRGDRTRWSPEDLIVGSLSACHQLWYLHLCADAGIVVVAYEDSAQGAMAEEPDGGGRFTRVLLRPKVTIEKGGNAELAASLHEKAHEKCFIARSVRFPVECEPTIVFAD